MTAREFAAAVDRPYPTVALWLRQNKVPGAYQEKVGDFSVWQIPVEAVNEFKPPVLGRPPKLADADGEEASAPEAKAVKTTKRAITKKAAKSSVKAEGKAATAKFAKKSRKKGEQ